MWIKTNLINEIGLKVICYKDKKFMVYFANVLTLKIYSRTIYVKKYLNMYETYVLKNMQPIMNEKK